MDEATRPEERYPPIGDYAMIGDCRTGALVSKSGSVDWLCMPEFFSDAVFGAMLDADKGGRFALRPARPCRVSRRYRQDTAVLETTFAAEDGELRVTDCMPLGGGRDADELQPERELLRKVEALSGSPELEVVFEPRPNFGQCRPRIDGGNGDGWRFRFRNRLFILRSALPLAATPDGSALHCRTRLRPGQACFLSLSCTEDDIAVYPPLGELAAERLDATEQWWCSWSSRCTYHGPHRDLVQRSAITLKMLNYSLSGAVLAAPTTSLPEQLGGERNWDYRYCWLRDAAFTLRVFLDLGYVEEGDSFLGWLLHTTRLTWPKLGILYDIFGRPPPAERELRHLEGYCGSRPVRIGNGARSQLQLDLYGEIILAAYDYADRGGRLDRYDQRLLLGFGRTVVRCWKQPDNSIWEVRGKRRHYTFSKVMCWAALDCLLEMHDRGMLKAPAKHLRAVRDEIRDTIEAHGLNGDHGAYAGIFDSDAMDAALLQMIRVGYREPGDPVLTRTHAMIRERLSERGLVRRYGKGFDPMKGGEGAFGVCTFWEVGHLVAEGRVDEAQRVFERAVGYANDLGLFAEEICPTTGEALGNFPQAFTHVGLIDAALALHGAGTGRGERPGVL